MRNLPGEGSRAAGPGCAVGDPEPERPAGGPASWLASERASRVRFAGLLRSLVAFRGARRPAILPLALRAGAASERGAEPEGPGPTDPVAFAAA